MGLGRTKYSQVCLFKPSNGHKLCSDRDAVELVSSYILNTNSSF